MAKQKQTKQTLIQIGKDFYSLKYEFSIKDTHELKLLIDSKKFNLKLLRED